MACFEWWRREARGPMEPGDSGARTPGIMYAVRQLRPTSRALLLAGVLLSLVCLVACAIEEICRAAGCILCEQR